MPLKFGIVGKLLVRRTRESFPFRERLGGVIFEQRLLDNQRALIGCPTVTVTACGQSAPRTVQRPQRSQPFQPSFCVFFFATNDGRFLGWSVFLAHMQLCNDEEKE